MVGNDVTLIESLTKNWEKCECIRHECDGKMLQTMYLKTEQIITQS